MDSVLHRLEALPGSRRYAVTFRRPDGSEQTATIQLTDHDVLVAAASLPDGWQRDSDAFRATAAALAAFDAARSRGPQGALLRDPDGGWDVSVGNVVLGPAGAPCCIAHGDMTRAGTTFTCGECGATAVLG